MTQRTQYWLQAFLWLTGIYTSIPFVRPLCEALRERALLNVTIYASALMVAGLFIRSLGYSKRRDILTWLLLAMAMMFYAAGFYFIKIPEERLHFIEYGILSCLVHRAIRLDNEKVSAYLLSFLMTGLCGWGDEILQGLTPGRFYTLKDVELNAISAALGLFADFIRRRLPKPRRND